LSTWIILMTNKVNHHFPALRFLFFIYLTAK